MAIIQIEGVEKTYQDGKTEVAALRGIDLTFEAGEFSALAGPSGSGKTTLLNILSGLDLPTRGTVQLVGRDLSGLSPGKLSEIRLHDIGFVFQAYNLIPVLTARENVEFTMLLQGVTPGERKERAMQMLERVGLGEEANRKPAALSGGQQQRVAVCRAIVTRPKIVLADEPTANLDSETGKNLLNLMHELNKEDGTTFLFSTHDPMVMERSSRLVRLRDGLVQSDERS